MKYPTFARRWARRRAERMLKNAEARLADSRAEKARLERFQRSFGGRQRRLLEQERAIKKQERNVAKLKDALGAPA